MAFGRTEGFCFEVDGGVFLPAADLRAGDFTRVALKACGPYDFLARPKTGPPSEVR